MPTPYLVVFQANTSLSGTEADDHVADILSEKDDKMYSHLERKGHRSHLLARFARQMLLVLVEQLVDQPPGGVVDQKEISSAIGHQSSQDLSLANLGQILRMSFAGVFWGGGTVNQLGGMGQGGESERNDEGEAGSPDSTAAGVVGCVVEPGLVPFQSA